MATVKNFFIITLLLGGLAALNGCSIIGFAIGAHADAKHKRVETEPIALTDLEKGREVKVMLSSGSILQGVFIGLETGDSGNEIMAMERDGRPMKFPVDTAENIVVVHRRTSINRRVTGFLVGLAADIIFWSTFDPDNLFPGGPML
jgi:hypothetical protein